MRLDQTRKGACGQNDVTSYPAVLLGVPLGAEGVERLAPLGAVGKLEEAGERAPVFGRVGEDGVLEVDAMGEDVVVLIHSAVGTDSEERTEAAAGIIGLDSSFSTEYDQSDQLRMHFIT